ncbi:uncharacterized protein LOC124823014 [Vigna umbellata]|uniref:uncharacterized protein LOC124823014 n=1 Tax=Vigna umbellata TaxID=87088 RepID=UPI001F5FAF29|nr:uncharacterized protein LOC124823014 [Vigna umbellata]
MIVTVLFVLYLFSSHVSYKVDGNPSIQKDDWELERQLEIITKPAIKSIHMKNGQIVDCIDIYKQPSFDHPLLKGHKLQKKPNFQNVTGEISQKTSRTRPMFGLGKHECPTGTVPILRTTKDDLIREKSLLNDHILLQDIPGVHVAEVSVKPNYGPYYGVGGFVQTSKEIFIGRSIGTISQYGGRLCVLAFSITQDPITKNWWISIDNKPIGYFPAKLFSNMSSANEVGWGGRTRTHPGTQSPKMGSGHFPHDDNPTHACYYKQISIQDNERKTHGVKVYEANSFTDKPNCYDVRYYGNKGPHFGNILMFGGPGGNCGN